MVSWGARQIDDVRSYSEDVGRAGELLTVEQEQELGAASLAGDRAARDELVRCNLRLVMHEALRYCWGDMPLADLIQAGNMGLIRAAEMYDPAKGCRFSTYAVWRIRQEIRREMTGMGRTIRAPHAEVQLCWRVKALRQWRPDLCDEQLASELGVDARDLRHALAMDMALCSLDMIVEDNSGDDGRPLLEMLADDGATVEDTAEIGCMRADIENALTDLPPRTREAISAYYLSNEQPTLSQIGVRLGLSGEGVRHVIRDGLNRLAQNRGLQAWRECVI